MKHKICMVGLASGVVLGTLGYTHCSIEDMSIIRSIPGITIISPADCTETVKATQAAIKHKNSIYLRLTGGMNQPVVYNKDYNFEIGKGIKLSDKGDISIIATGTMVHKSMEAAKILEIKLNEFRNSIERVTTVSSDRKEALKMSISKDSVQLSVNNPNSGDGVENIDAKFNSSDFNISFNSRYLTDITSQIENENVFIYIKDPGSPVIVKDLSLIHI